MSKVPSHIVTSFDRFDKAAQTWGLEADQGVYGVEAAQAEYHSAKCDLIADMVEHEANLAKEVERLRELILEIKDEVQAFVPHSGDWIKNAEYALNPSKDATP